MDESSLTRQSEAKIMSKTGKASKVAALDHRLLADSELDAVSGGFVPTSVDVGNLKVTEQRS